MTLPHYIAIALGLPTFIVIAYCIVSLIDYIFNKNNTKEKK